MAVPQVDAALAIYLAHGVNQRVLQDRETRERQDAAYLLSFAQHVGLNDRRGSAGELSRHQFAQSLDGHGPRREPVLRIAEGAFDDQDFGFGKLGPLGGRRFAQFEVAGV